MVFYAIKYVLTKLIKYLYAYKYKEIDIYF